MVEYLTENQRKAGSIPPIGKVGIAQQGRAMVFKIIDVGSNPTTCKSCVTELVDVVDLKSAAFACGFKSRHRHIINIDIFK
jgi:hypothetical protein